MCEVGRVCVRLVGNVLGWSGMCEGGRVCVV